MWFLLLLVHSIPAAAYTQLCRCNCGANYTVLSVPVCTNCTRQFCIKSVEICQKDWVTLDQVTTSCFQRESFKDKLFIYSFILVTSGLLIYASVQHYAADWANRVSLPPDILPQPIINISSYSVAEAYLVLHLNQLNALVLIIPSLPHFRVCWCTMHQVGENLCLNMENVN